MATYRVYTKEDGSKSVTARVRVGGIQRVKTFSTKTAAKAWAKSQEVKLKEAPHLAASEAHKHTLAQAIGRYIETVVPNKAPGSQAKDIQRLQWWKDAYGHLTLDRLQAPVLVEARDRLATEETRRKGQKTPMRRAPATVNRYLAVLAHLLKIAYREWHWISSNPAEQVSKLREPPGRVRFLNDQAEHGKSELTRLLEACAESESPLLYPAVLLAIATGGRRNEVLGLTWGDIDFDRNLVVLSGAKTQSPRTVGIPEEILSILRPRQGLPNALVFPAPPDPKRPERPRVPIDLTAAWKTALRRAGIENMRWHDLRHTAASYLAMSGASLADIAGVLGHRTLQMVGRYSHLSREHIAQASVAIGKRVLGGE